MDTYEIVRAVVEHFRDAHEDGTVEEIASLISNSQVSDVYRELDRLANGMLIVASYRRTPGFRRVRVYGPSRWVLAVLLETASAHGSLDHEIHEIVEGYQNCK